MKINYSKVRYAIIELELAASNACEYDEENRIYVLDTDKLKKPFNELKKLIAGEKNSK